MENCILTLLLHSPLQPHIQKSLSEGDRFTLKVPFSGWNSIHGVAQLSKLSVASGWNFLSERAYVIKELKNG